MLTEAVKFRAGFLTVSRTPNQSHTHKFCDKDIYCPPSSSRAWRGGKPPRDINLPSLDDHCPGHIPSALGVLHEEESEEQGSPNEAMTGEVDIETGSDGCEEVDSKGVPFSDGIGESPDTPEQDNKFGIEPDVNLCRN